MATGATGATGPASSFSSAPASATTSGVIGPTSPGESIAAELGPSRLIGMDSHVAVQTAALRHREEPFSRLSPPGVTGATGAGPTGATALVASSLSPEYRLGDGIHSHQELKLVAHIGPPTRVVKVDTATLGTPLDALVFLLAIVLAIAAGQLWHRALEFVAPHRSATAA